MHTYIRLQMYAKRQSRNNIQDVPNYNINIDEFNSLRALVYKFAKGPVLCCYATAKRINP